MSDFFAFPTVNSYEEDVFQLTAAGIVTVAALLLALIAAAVLLRPKKERTVRTATKQLVFSGVAMALAIVASEIKFARLPFGGSVTLFSMLFIVLIGYWYGAKAGLLTGFCIRPAPVYPGSRILLSLAASGGLSAGLRLPGTFRIFQQKAARAPVRIPGRRFRKVLFRLSVRRDLLRLLRPDSDSPGHRDLLSGLQRVLYSAGSHGNGSHPGHSRRQKGL